MASDSQECNFESKVKRLKLRTLSNVDGSVAELDNLIMRLTVGSGNKVLLEFLKVIGSYEDDPNQNVLELELGKVPLTVQFKGNEVYFHWVSDQQLSELMVELPEESLSSNFIVRATYLFELKLRSLKGVRLRVEREIQCLPDPNIGELQKKIDSIVTSQTYKGLKSQAERVLNNHPTLADTGLSRSLEFCSRNKRGLIEAIKMHLKSKQ